MSTKENPMSTVNFSSHFSAAAEKMKIRRRFMEIHGDVTGVSHFVAILEYRL